MTSLNKPLLSDVEILHRISAGDAAALEVWFRRHRDAVYSFVFYRVGGDPELAADALQSTFTVALERLTEFDPQRGEMKTWLRYLSRNIIRTLLAKHRRGAQFPLVGSELEESERDGWLLIGVEPLPHTALEREETRALVGQALAGLTDEYQELLLAKYVDNKSLQDLASRSETTIDGVKSQLRRARAAFRDAFLTVASAEPSEAR